MGDYENLADELINEYMDNIEEGNDLVLKYAVQNCPELTGRLKRSVKKYRLKNGWATAFETDYAIIVEKRPEGRGYKFLERGYSEHEEEIDNVIRGD